MSRAVTVNALSLPPGSLGSAGLGLLVLLLLTVSPLALMALGWQYGETGGSPIEKFHPATFLAMGLVLLSASHRGNPLSALIATAGANPAVTIYLAGVLGLMAHAALVVGLPATTFVDTFILPIATLFLFRDLGDGRRAGLARLVHILFALNTGLGIAELQGGFRLTPLYVEGEFLETEWRSSALLGHPLGNACLSAPTWCCCSRAADAISSRSCALLRSSSPPPAWLCSADVPPPPLSSPPSFFQAFRHVQRS